MRFSPDGARIVTASYANSARVWDAATGQFIAALLLHDGAVNRAEFSLDGARIVTASDDTTVRVWDATTGKNVATLSGHAGAVYSAQFSPNGSCIVTASADKTARVWDAAGGKAIATLSHEGFVMSGQFSPDSSRIVTALLDKTARVGTVLPPSASAPPEWFADFLRYLAQMRLNSDGELEKLKPEDWLSLQERMRTVRRASAGQETPYLEVLRRFVSE